MKMVRLPYEENDAFSAVTFPHYAVGFISILLTLALLEYPLFRFLEHGARHQTPGQKELARATVPSGEIRHEAAGPNPEK